MSSRSSLNELRQKHYSYLKKRFPYIFHWKRYPYRNLKLKLYIEGGCLLAYFLIKLKVKANHVTAAYALMGLSGGILLAISLKVTILIAAFFYYFRGILDVADGIVARENNQASINGTVFNSYAAHVGWISLWAGAGIYLGNSTSEIFYFLSPVIPALFAANLHSNAIETFISHRILQRYTEQDSNYTSLQKGIVKTSKIRKIKNAIDKIFEHNARTLDLIMLMILFETFAHYRIFWLFFTGFLFWQIIIFAVRFLMITRGGWAESELRELRKTLFINKEI